jgi:hypothetical protein
MIKINKRLARAVCSPRGMGRIDGAIGQDEMRHKVTAFLSKQRYYNRVIFAIVVLLFSCEDQGMRAYYHWKSAYRPTEATRAYLTTLKVRKQYIRYFDVDWAGKPVPVGILSWEGVPELESLVPCVFITNRSMAMLSDTAVAELAERIYEKIRDLSGLALWGLVREVQLDCDWTDETRDRYFSLLRLLREKLHEEGRQLSVTIRLDQYRYPSLRGVPPVDRGMLMCYNMGDVGEWEERNSILDLGLVSAYLRGAGRYAIPLDVALPVFRWVVVYRDGRLVRLVHGLGEEDMRDEERFVWVGEGRYEVKRGTYLSGVYLYEGDRLRVEGVRPEELSALVEAIRRKLGVGMTVSMYHLEEGIIGRYPAENLSKLYDRMGL